MLNYLYYLVRRILRLKLPIGKTYVTIIHAILLVRASGSRAGPLRWYTCCIAVPRPVGTNLIYRIATHITAEPLTTRNITKTHQG